MVFQRLSHGLPMVFPMVFTDLHPMHFQVLVMEPIWPGQRLGDVVRLTCPLLVSAIDRYEKQGALRGEQGLVECDKSSPGLVDAYKGLYYPICVYIIVYIYI